MVLISAVYSKRDPKLFFVSTSSTTSTLTTASQCYLTSVASGTIPACGGKRRRSVITNGALEDDEKIITASRLEPSINEPEAKSQR